MRRLSAAAAVGGCLLLGLVLLFQPAACGRGGEDGRPVVEVWFHSAQPAERETLKDQIRRFNEGQSDFRVCLTVIPEGAYSGQVQASAVAGNLPDLLEFDGPYVYNYVWQGILLPLDDRLPDAVREDLLPSILAQGTYRGALYSVGTFDSGLGLYGRRSLLTKAGIRVPEDPSGAWSAAAFEAALAKLSENDPDGRVLDLKLNYPGNEWFTYAFSPPLWSAGGGLIDRKTHGAADGVLNGPASVSALERIQGWFQDGYVDPNLDDAAFTEGRVALSWVGHWEYARYRDAWGADLAVLPLPDFGRGTRTGQGSWNWGIPKSSRRPKLAMRFLAFLLEPEQVLAMTKANGAVPATRGAVARSELYGPGGPLRLFARQLLEGYAVPRPRTPAYPVISSAFAGAFHDIRNGADVREALDGAARTIDQDIRMNRGYPDPETLKERGDG